MKFKEIKMGNGFSLEVPDYTFAQIKNMFDKYRGNKDVKIKNQLIEACMPLVVEKAKEVYAKDKTVELDDLISGGFEKLGVIVDGYKSNNGALYSYLSTSIYHTLINVISNTRLTVHIPRSMKEKIENVKKAKEFFENKNKRKPTINELASLTGIKYSVLKDILFYMNANKMIDINEIEIPTEDNTEEIIKSIDKKELKKIVDSELNDIEKKIIYDRFGLDGQEKKTFGQISKELNLTNERIRQIETKALRKLQIPVYRFYSKDYKNLLSDSYDRTRSSTDYTKKDTAYGYSDYYKDYEGYTEEEYEDRGIGYR